MSNETAEIIDYKVVYDKWKDLTVTSSSDYRKIDLFGTLCMWKENDKS